MMTEATRYLSALLLVVALFSAFIIAILPEPPARLLTAADGWKVRGPEGSRVPFQLFPQQYRHLRRSVEESGDGYVFRTWTPEIGIAPLEVVSAPFRPARYMSIAVTGMKYSPDGLVNAFIECEATGTRFDVFRGGVNVNVTEAIVATPDGWCPGNATLRFSSAEKSINAGIGSAYEISLLSYLKTTFVGLIPYFVISLAVFSVVMLSGGALAVRLGADKYSVPAAFMTLGIVSLAVFYLDSSIALEWRWIGVVFVGLVVMLVLYLCRLRGVVSAARILMPYAQVWLLSSFLYFAVLGLVENNSGHWDVNYRFWPATWSSDNELPWMFAEAIRNGWHLSSLFGGGWIPTDRPPLMAGAYLLLTDLFGWLQVGNDGTYLRGETYNAAAVTLNALWVPAVWWLLTSLRPGIDDRSRTSILVFLGCLPFVLFNTVYGWPKAFGAAFALMAFGLAWQSRDENSSEIRNLTIIMFFVSGALSMLAHTSTALFLAPLGMLFLWLTLRRNFRVILTGFTTALTLLLSWSLYKWLVLPSADPITKYALTGDYAFDHPEWSLWKMLANRYGDMTFWQWLEIKWTMLRQPFFPLQHPIAQIGLNADYGTGTIDKFRAWDFMLLSGGNLAIPFLILLAAWVSFVVFASGRRDMLNDIAPYIALAGVSLAAWLLILFGFLVPPVGPVWPQAAVFGMALSGAFIVRTYYPLVFTITLLATMVYTTVVWLLSPLVSALRLDIGAASALAVLGAWALVSRYLPALVCTPNVRYSMSSIGFSMGAVATQIRSNSMIQRLGNAVVWTIAMRIITIGALVFASYIAIRFIQQPLADVHSFRQAQTALTSYWILKEGWSLAYQTPIAGYPWSIPFEFPIYQGLVAAIAALSGFELEPVGRFVSYAFLIACAWPAIAVSRRLALPRAVPWVFCALLWTAPINVYWARTFMIETAALFFTLACMPYGIDLIRRAGGWRSAAMFVMFASVAVLQKVTTGGPVLLFLLMSAVFVHVRSNGLNLRGLRLLMYPLAVIAVPLVIGWAWTHFTDVVKADNPFGRQMTSDVLKAWNFGTIGQKLDIGTWHLVIWERSFKWNAAGLAGVLLLLMPWFGGQPYRRFAWLSLTAFALFVIPIAIFTNVHIIHEYYQVACVPFLLGALAIVIGGWLREVTGTMLVVPITTAVIVVSNLMFFNSTYGVVAARSIDELDARSVQAYRVGRYLREHTESTTGLVIFGQDYSSEIAFQAQRKSMTAPPWFSEYAQLWKQPQAYLGDTPLGAIVICPVTADFPTMMDIQERITIESSLIHESVYGCELLISSSTKALQ